MTKALFAASLITCFSPTGSITLIAMASASSTSSASLMSPFCSFAAPVFVLLNATVTSASSASAFSHPLRAIFQKSDVALVIKATVFTAFGAFGGEAQLPDVTKIKASKQMNLCEVDRFMAKSPMKELPTINPEARTQCTAVYPLQKKVNTACSARLLRFWVRESFVRESSMRVFGPFCRSLCLLDDKRLIFLK